MSSGSALASRSRRAFAAATLLAAASACATTRVPDDRDAAFSLAVEASQGVRPEVSANAAYAYLKGATPDDPRYDRAVRLLARSTEALGLTYAASLWYLEIAEARRDVTLLPEAVRGLERIVMGGPHDEENIVRGFLASEELSELPSDIQAFVDYEQGLDSARHGLDDWADARFAKIPASSPYALRARYVQAVRLVARRDLKEAEAAFSELAEAENLPADLAADIHRSLARIHFENKEWAEALEHYETIRQLAPDDPELLLEMAWTYYYRGDSRRALGLLFALDAPVYQDLIAPERFLLEALALRRLCQFGPARRAAVRLRERHGDALDDIYRGVALTTSPALRAAAAHRGESRDVARYVERLKAERAAVDGRRDLSRDFRAHLDDIYASGLAEAERRFDASLAGEVDGVADDLLAADEGVRLILHELGVSLLRGRRRPSGPEEVAAPQIQPGGDRTFFKFEGEFWTDELDDLVVFAEDRCID